MDDGGDLARLPRRVALAYLAVGATWIVVSDGLVAVIAGDLSLSVLLGMAKGLAFIAVTTVVLLLLLRRLTSGTLVAHRAVAEERQRLTALIRSSSDVLSIIDDDARLSFVSPSAAQVVGWEVEELVGRDLLELVHPDDRALALQIRGRGPMDHDPLVIRVLTASGGWRHLEIAASTQVSEAATPGLVVNARDVTDRVMAERALDHARDHDRVTGLGNRQRFERAIRDLGLALHARGGGELVVMVTDVDRFHEVNAELGTEGGDDALRLMARRLEAGCPVGGVVGSLGADQLGLAFGVRAGTNVEAEVRLMAEGLRRTLGAPFELQGRELALSITCGAAVLPHDAAPLEALLAAEATRSQARSMPDRIAVAMDPPGVPDRIRIPDLRTAIDQEQLQLHYQTQHDLATGRVVGLEALIRWHHPGRGLLLPAAFLADAEASGLQPAVTRLVLRQATRFLARLGDHPRVTLSVNLSLDDLSRTGLVDEVVGAVRAAAVDPSRLRLELTERALLVQPERSLRTVHRLREHGLTLSFDDFGTGYSSLAHLQSLPVDELKIDRSFVADLSHPTSLAIVRTVIDLGDRMGITTVAEGIEDSDTLDVLTDLGCPVGQGYHLSRPEEAELALDRVRSDG